MCRWMLLVLVLFAPALAHARSYTAGDQALRPGWWHDPARAGWAFTLSPAGDQLAGTLLTFDAAGEATWYLAVGRGDGRSWTLPVTRHRWDVGANRARSIETVGSFTFTLEREGEARAEWTILGESGAASLVPLELAPGYSAEDRSGHWFADGESGHGYTVYSQGDWLTLVHYGYDAAGEPRWVYADNHGEPARRLLDAVYFRRACVDCDASVHDAGRIEIALPFEHEGVARLDLSLPAPLSGGFRREFQTIRLLTDLPSGRVHPAALARFAGDATLRDYLQAAVAQRGFGTPGCRIDFSPAPVPTAAAPGVSGTNLQEAGVDEADVVESDGEYAYAIASGEPPRASYLLRTHRLDPERADLALTSETGFVAGTLGDPPAEGLYLVPPDEGPRLLAAVRGVPPNYAFMPWFGCGGHGNGPTSLEIHTLADRGRPQRAHLVELDGALVASRRIGRTVYLVTRYTPTVEGLAYAPREPAAIARNAALLAAVPLDELVASIRVDGAAPHPIATPATTLLPPLPPNRRAPTVMTVTAIPLDDPAAHRSLSVVGDDEGVYMSLDAIYLATSRVESTIEDGRYLYPPAYFTDFHRIALAPLSYSASGTAPGSLGSAPDRKAFHMSEHAGTFRVLTEQRDPDGGTHNRLFVFEPDAQTRRLDEIARLPNAARPATIGKPNELLYSIRFVGERAYAVTFLNTDPLYTIDLSNPRDPRIAGALEIPGYSAYLHPLPGGRLLGFGKDAVSSTVTGDDGSFAWYQGLRLSLFDVTNDAAPRQVAVRDYGRRGSDSALLHDHHAFASLERGGATRVALPLHVHDVPPGGTIDPDPRHFYPYAWRGFALFELGADGALRDRGTVVTGRSSGPMRYEPAPRDARVVLVGDVVYAFENGGWYGARWSAPELVTPRR